MIDEAMYMPPEESIRPDSWVIVEIQDPIHPGMPPIQKIISGWSGSYLYGDSWRMSSRIRQLNIKADSDYIEAITESGSTYKLLKQYQGLRMSNEGIYMQLKQKFGDSLEIVEL